MTAIQIDKLENIIKWADENNISSSIIPREKDILLSIKILNLNNLNLTNIPKEIDVLKEIEELYISYNKLTNLPIELYNLTNLNSLWMQGNKLTIIDDAITNLTNIEFIQAFDNNIRKIPNDISDMEELKIFTLYYNDFPEDYAHNNKDKLNLYTFCDDLPKDIDIKKLKNRAEDFFRIIVNPKIAISITAEDVQVVVFKNEINPKITILDVDIIHQSMDNDLIIKRIKDLNQKYNVKSIDVSSSIYYSKKLLTDNSFIMTRIIQNVFPDIKKEYLPAKPQANEEYKEIENGFFNFSSKEALKLNKLIHTMSNIKIDLLKIFELNRTLSISNQVFSIVPLTYNEGIDYSINISNNINLLKFISINISYERRNLKLPSCFKKIDGDLEIELRREYKVLIENINTLTKDVEKYKENKKIIKELIKELIKLKLMIADNTKLSNISKV